jgi:hypothetical protein
VKEKERKWKDEIKMVKYNKQGKIKTDKGCGQDSIGVWHEGENIIFRMGAGEKICKPIYRPPSACMCMHQID